MTKQSELIGRDVIFSSETPYCQQTAVKRMSLVYDNIYEITRDTFDLISWLQDKGVIGNFGGRLCALSGGKNYPKKGLELRKRRLSVALHKEGSRNFRPKIGPAMTSSMRIKTSKTKKKHSREN